MKNLKPWLPVIIMAILIALFSTFLPAQGGFPKSDPSTLTSPYVVVNHANGTTGVLLDSLGGSSAAKTYAQGLIDSSNVVQLGNPTSVTNSTDRFLQNRYIPLNGKSLIFGDNTASSLLRINGGTDSIGIGTTALAKLHVRGLTEQLRLAYDDTKFIKLTVTSGGQLDIAPGTANASNFFTVKNLAGTNILSIDNFNNRITTGATPASNHARAFNIDGTTAGESPLRVIGPSSSIGPDGFCSGIELFGDDGTSGGDKVAAEIVALGGPVHWEAGAVGDARLVFRILANGSSTPVERFRIDEAGGLAVNSSFGTAGQVLTTNGAGAAATWNTPTATTASEGISASGADLRLGGSYFLNHPSEFSAGRKLNWGNFITYIGTDDTDSLKTFVFDIQNKRLGIGAASNLPNLFIKGSGTTTSTVTLHAQNSDATGNMRFFDSGLLGINGATYTNGSLAVNAIAGQTRIARFGEIEFVTNGSPGSTGQGFSCAGTNRVPEFIFSRTNATDNYGITFRSVGVTSTAFYNRLTGTIANFNFEAGATPVGGTASYIGLRLSNNANGSSSNPYVGIYVERVGLVGAQEYRAIETETGHIVLGEYGSTTTYDGTATKILGVNASDKVVASAGIIDNLVAEVTTTGTAQKFKTILVDVSAGAATITPPSSPTAGDWFCVSDSRANAATFNITVDVSGDKLHAAANDYVMNTNADFLKLTYVNATVGWIKSKSN